MTPTELRTKRPRQVNGHSAELRFRLSYRPPLDWEQILGFLARRAIPQVEVVQDGAYYRTVKLTRKGREHVGFLEARHEADRQMISVRLSDALLSVCGEALERIRRLFDLHADPANINAALGSLALDRPGLRVPGSFDGFEIAVRAILGQQISVAGARTLAGRLAARFGAAVSTPVPTLGHIFPTPLAIAQASVKEIRDLGITARRAESLIALAQAINGGNLILEPGNRLEGTLRSLRKIPGVGEWTAQYIAMRALSWPDAFPHTDLGIRRALGENNPKKIIEIAEKWRPWRAYAALHLWAAAGKNL